MKDSRDLETAVQNLNFLIYSNIDPGTSVTPFLADIDRTTRQLCSIWAGHDEPSILRSDGSVEMLEADSKHPSIQPEVQRISVTGQLAPRDILCLCTVGATDAGQSAENVFGAARLVDVLRRYRHKRVAMHGNVELAVALTFTQLKQQEDDLPLLVHKAAYEFTIV